MISVSFAGRSFCGSFDYIDELVITVRKNLRMTRKEIMEDLRKEEEKSNGRFVDYPDVGTETIDRLYNNMLGQSNPDLNEVNRKRNLDDILTGNLDEELDMELRRNPWYKDFKQETETKGLPWNVLHCLRLARRYDILMREIQHYLNAASVTWSTKRCGDLLWIYGTSLKDKKTFRLSQLLEVIFCGEDGIKMSIQEALQTATKDTIYKYFYHIFTVIERRSNYFTSSTVEHVDIDKLLNIGVVCLCYKMAQERREELLEEGVGYFPEVRRTSIKQLLLAA